MSCTRTKHGASRDSKQRPLYIKLSTLPLVGSTGNTAIQSLYRHVACDVPVSCKTNGDSNQLWAWLDSDPKVD